MDTTTTTLPDDLTAALKRTGVTRYRAQRIVQLLPDRGRHELLTALNDDTLNQLLTRWVEELGDILRVRTAVAAQIRDLLTMGATR